jgi:hypothetical protein
MKKVSLILLVVILASVALMAAAPMKLVRLTFINKSGHVIYIKLEGKVEDNFYYLTVPYGTKEIPDDVTFTVMQDVYTRTTWYGPGDLGCEGVKSSGELWAVKQSKFVFTPCDQPSWQTKWDPIAGEWVRVSNYGEPTWGEKIVYYKYIEAYALNVFSGGCYWSVKTKTYKSPGGSCFFLWKY